MAVKETLSFAGISVSIVLLGLKLWAGIVSGSVAVLSDAFNSFLDIFSYTAIFLSVRVQTRKPNKSYPFGYRRAEPLAGFIVAIMAVLLGITVVKDAAASLIQGAVVRRSGVPLLVLFISIAVKSVMAVLYKNFGEKTGSPALQAASLDSRNDVLSSLTAVTGFLLSGTWDGLAGIAIGLWILYSGVGMGLANSGYLLGRAPTAEFLRKVRELAVSVEGVSALNDIRAHFVGSSVDLEVHIEVNPGLKVGQAHDIGVLVQEKIQALEDVGTAFIHIDVLGDPVRIPL